jgi:ribonuclease P protein component
MSDSPAAPVSRPKTTSLSRQSDFSSIYKRGKRHRSRLLTAVVAAAPDGQDVIRVAFVVSKKVAKQAVRRNRIKRRLREAFRLQLSSAAPVMDFILIAQPEAAKADYAHLHATVGDLMRRAGLSAAVEPERDR